jgi:hypothetical protein
MSTEDDISRFFSDRVPADWFVAAPAVEWDDDEILCVGRLREPVDAGSFRESTRAERMAIAGDAEARFGRKVSWGVHSDGAETLFTTQSTPVTSRLRFRERAVLDTLIDAGIASSRNEAVAWCVKLVERHEGEWLSELRDALSDVERARTEGPTLL